MLLSRPKEEVEQRTKAIRADFYKRYDLDVLREQIFNEQSGACAICKQPLQSSDSVVCSVDHATPVFLYANWEFTIEEACKHANARRNLLAVHVVCNTAKRESDYEEFIGLLGRGEVSLDEPEMLTTERLDELRQQLSERNREKGRKGGRKNVESRHIIKLGKLWGTKNVESGHLTRVRNLPQFKSAQIRNGLALGRKNVESGLLARLRTPEHQRRVARIAGRKAVESGQLASIAGKGAHVRLHVNRNRPNPRCVYCSESSLIVAFG